MKKTLVIALLAAFATPALAEDPVAAFFVEWDLNSNGEVTQLEARNRLTAVFSGFDTNMDGYLDADDEVVGETGEAPDEEENGAVVGFGDENGDGRVSLLEFIDRSGEWIDMMDRDSDGVITIGDFNVAEG